MKRMLIVGIALVVALGTSAIAFAATYDYNTEGTVYMTLEIPVILVLDMGDPDTDFIWFTATAADLDNGFVVRRGATKIGIRSNDPDGWNLSVATVGDGAGKFTKQGSGDLALTALYVESGCIQTPSTVDATLEVIGFSHNVACVQTCPYTADHTGEWVAFTVADCTSRIPASAAGGLSADGLVAESTSQGDGWVIMVDYKIKIDWYTKADTYCTCLTYTLAGKP